MDKQYVVDSSNDPYVKKPCDAAAAAGAANHSRNRKKTKQDCSSISKNKGRGSSSEAAAAAAAADAAVPKLREDTTEDMKVSSKLCLLFCVFVSSN